MTYYYRVCIRIGSCKSLSKGSKVSLEAFWNSKQRWGIHLEIILLNLYYSFLSFHEGYNIICTNYNQYIYYTLPGNCIIQNFMLWGASATIYSSYYLLNFYVFLLMTNTSFVCLEYEKQKQPNIKLNLNKILLYPTIVYNCKPLKIHEVLGRFVYLFPWYLWLFVTSDPINKLMIIYIISHEKKVLCSSFGTFFKNLPSN